jgi:hypothetical protein
VSEVLLRALVAERETGMPGPPPAKKESPRLKQSRLLELDRAMCRRSRGGVNPTDLLIGQR